MAKAKDQVYGTTVRVKAEAVPHLTPKAIEELVNIAAKLDIDLIVQYPGRA